MCKTNLELVSEFFQNAMVNSVEVDVSPWLHEQVCYELLIAKAEPVHSLMKGRELVSIYLSFVRHGYQVLEAAPMNLMSHQDTVIVQGSETVQLVVSGELVHAEWIAVYELEQGLIKKISMTIYKWTPGVSRPQAETISESVRGAKLFSVPMALEVSGLEASVPPAAVHASAGASRPGADRRGRAAQRRAKTDN